MNISKSTHHRLATKNSFTPLTEEKVSQIQRCIIGSYFLGTRYFVPKQKCLIIERNRVFQRIQIFATIFKSILLYYNLLMFHRCPA